MAEFRVVIDATQDRSEPSFVWIWRDVFGVPEKLCNSPYGAIRAMVVHLSYFSFNFNIP